ncbi:MAG: uracil-DNA glycosylase [bacterium]
MADECKWYSVCPLKRYYERGKLAEKWVSNFCHGDYNSCVRYQLEERGEFHPDYMLPDGSLDESLKRA